jgi:ectoine hydroxylase-related dioxygenase (phytanoyl-CoA dioxygenase family)
MLSLSRKKPVKKAVSPGTSGRTLQQHAEELREQGFTIIEGVLNPEQVEAGRRALDEIFESERAIGRERNWHNKQYMVSYLLPQKHPLFRTLCFSEPVLELMRELLGERFVLGSMNGFSTTPGGEAQSLHIDQWESIPHQVLTINVTHTLDDFTVANGCTRGIPGSQNRVWQRGMDTRSLEPETVYFEAPAGSVIAFNGGLWHAGSQNTTKLPRRAVHAFFHRSWIVPQWDYARSLSPDVIEQLTPEQKRLFGFNARAPWFDVEKQEIVKEKV